MTSPQEDPKQRAELLSRVEALHAVDKLEGARFLAGGRMRVHSGVDEAAARRAVTKIVMLGAKATIEPSRAVDDSMLSLDQFADGGEDAAGGPAVNEQMLAQLQSLDGDEAAPSAPAPSERAAAADPAPPHAAVAPAPVVEPAVDDERFRPSGEWQKPMELQLDVAPRPTAPSPPPASDDASDDAVLPGQRLERPALVAAEEPWQPVPGRLANGALRKRPPVRIAIGVVLGLGLGWLFAQPYAQRAERKVAAMRADADRERYRPVDEVQARVRELDRQADDASSSGAIGMAVIWVVVGGAAFAGWWRVT